MTFTPGRVISQLEIEQETVRLLANLEKATEEFGDLAEDHAKKEARYKSKWAQEFLGGEGTVKDRESRADYRLADPLFELKIADALLRAKREQLSTIRTSLDSLRTLAANLRIQT